MNRRHLLGGGDLAPRGPLWPEDVRFLLLHHAMPNSYAQSSVPGVLRGIYAFHTGREKLDVAYNFFVDRFGGVYCPGHVGYWMLASDLPQRVAAERATA